MAAVCRARDRGLSTLVNRTRRSVSIPKRLASERKAHLIPFYYLLRTSDLAREAMEHSGSYRFADHIYAGRASGRFGFGTLLDGLLLSLPSARSFRNRFIHVKKVLREFLLANEGLIVVLSIPCGIPRDLVGAATELRSLDATRLDRTQFLLLDLDPQALRDARQFVDAAGLTRFFRTIEADALSANAIPPADFISSTGFTEFLDDDSVLGFYRACHEKLLPRGVFVTSSTIRHPTSAWLMEELTELEAHYRDELQTAAILRAAGFESAAIERDPNGFQVLVRASKRPPAHGQRSLYTPVK